MANNAWSWKGKDGSSSRLLYEPGNWGDVLKNLWLTQLAVWLRQNPAVEITRYNDYFAGAPCYPLAEKTKRRFDRLALPELEYLREAFIGESLWPSSASALKLLLDVPVMLCEKEAARSALWRDVPGVGFYKAESGWDALAATPPSPTELNMIDPYDILAEWRDVFSDIAARIGKTTLLIYGYNRSAKNREAFDNYRAFRNALEDAARGVPAFFGRIACDPFLPNAHHEMYLIPAPALSEQAAFADLTRRIAETTGGLCSAQRRFAEFDFL